MKYPYFCFWPERYWLDCHDLTDAEHGRYLQIIILLWNSPRCKIPNDPEWIARRLGRRSPEAFENEIKPLLLRFCLTDGNSWWQAKLMDEYQRARRRHDRASAGGKALSEKNKGKRSTSARPAAPSPAPTPTPTPTIKKEYTLANGLTIPLEPVANGHAKPIHHKPKNEFELFWLAYPKKKQKIDAEKAFHKALARVSFGALMGALEREKFEWAKGDFKWIPYPASWLNKGGWANEPEPIEPEPKFAIPR